MLRYVVAVALLVATPALAQQPPKAPPAVQALEMMLSQAVGREQNATTIALQQSEQIAALTVERDGLKAENAKLKAPAPTPEPAK
jgi:hypothetical protein